MIGYIVVKRWWRFDDVYSTEPEDHTENLEGELVVYKTIKSAQEKADELNRYAADCREGKLGDGHGGYLLGDYAEYEVEGINIE